MSILDHIAKAALDYDAMLKILGALAAPGGVWFWIDKYRNRIRIKVRNFGFIRGDQSGRGISFELENVGSATTSLEPTFRVLAYSPERERQRYSFKVEGNDRKLEPHELKLIQGWHSNPENRVVIFGWYMVFILPLTRGRNIRVRVRNAQFQQLRWLQFHWERMCFKLFGKVPG